MATTCPGYQAALLVEGRACSVRPARGSAPGAASAVVVHIGSDDSLSVATGWMPGRIALVRAGKLTDDCLRRLVGHECEAPFAAVIVLVDERDDVSRFGSIQASVPVVVAGRPADRIWLERAVHVDLSVHPEGQTVSVQPVRPRRDRHASVTFGTPGTVRPEELPFTSEAH